MGKLSLKKAVGLLVLFFLANEAQDRWSSFLPSGQSGVNQAYEAGRWEDFSPRGNLGNIDDDLPPQAGILEILDQFVGSLAKRLPVGDENQQESPAWDVGAIGSVEEVSTSADATSTAEFIESAGQPVPLLTYANQPHEGALEWAGYVYTQNEDGTYSCTCPEAACGGHTTSNKSGREGQAQIESWIKCHKILFHSIAQTNAAGDLVHRGYVYTQNGDGTYSCTCREPGCEYQKTTDKSGNEGLAEIKRWIKAHKSHFHRLQVNAAGDLVHRGYVYTQNGDGTYSCTCREPGCESQKTTAKTGDKGLVEIKIWIENHKKLFHRLQVNAAGDLVYSGYVYTQNGDGTYSCTCPEDRCESQKTTDRAGAAGLAQIKKWIADHKSQSHSLQTNAAGDLVYRGYVYTQNGDGTYSCTCREPGCESQKTTAKTGDKGLVEIKTWIEIHKKLSHRLQTNAAGDLMYSGYVYTQNGDGAYSFTCSEPRCTYQKTTDKSGAAGLDPIKRWIHCHKSYYHSAQTTAGRSSLPVDDEQAVPVMSVDLPFAGIAEDFQNDSESMHAEPSAKRRRA